MLFTDFISTINQSKKPVEERPIYLLMLNCTLHARPMDINICIYTHIKNAQLWTELSRVIVFVFKITLNPTCVFEYKFD